MRRILTCKLYTIGIVVIFVVLWGFNITLCERRLSRFLDITAYGGLGRESKSELEDFSQAIKYQYLSSEYKSYINKGEYEKIKTSYEAKSFFDSIPIEVNITKYNDYKYIDTEKFKTPIVNHAIDRRETIVYNIVLGVEKGWKPVIKRMKIILE